MNADRVLLEQLAEHFILLRRLAETSGPISCNGNPIKKWRAVITECDAARERIVQHLKDGK